MPAASRLVLNRDYMVQMLTAAEFYAAVPAFQYLQQAAMDAKDANVAGCKACQESHWPAMRGVCDAFFYKLRDLVQAGDPAVQQIKDWLSAKKQYTVKTCVLYYRYAENRDSIHRFEF